MYDPMTALRQAGFPIDQLSTAQRDVLASLTEQETAVLVSVQTRLMTADPEVVAHEVKML
jgi:hypothetical protein